MFGSEVLDVAIGLFVIYLILSTVCSGINEAIAGLLAKRAATLEEGLRSLLRDPQRTGVAKEFFEHPLISSLGSRTRAPSYIPSHLFAVALMDILVPSKEGQPTLERLRHVLAAESEGASEGMNEIKKALLPLIDNAGQEINRARESIEKWFDSAMDRVSGWYKRRQQRNILIIAAVTMVLVNADTIMIGNVLVRNPTIRAAAVELATQRVAQGATAAGQPGTPTGSSLERDRADLAGLQFPLGWTNVPWAQLLGAPAPARPALGPIPVSDFPHDFGTGLLKVMGLLITTAAVSLGAPFWFELLNKVIDLRSTGKPPKRTEETPDPQTSP